MVKSPKNKNASKIFSIFSSCKNYLIIDTALKQYLTRVLTELSGGSLEKKYFVFCPFVSIVHSLSK